MARPAKWKRICNMPNIDAYGPCTDNDDRGKINMTVEEFETIRLIDYKGLNQEECGKVMGVARSTIQRIYDDARKKIADSMVNGKILKIQGGKYKLCDDTLKCASSMRCMRRRFRGGND